VVLRADGEATHVVLHGLFGGVELLVVRAAARLMDQSEETEEESENTSRARKGGRPVTHCSTVLFTSHMKPSASWPSQTGPRRTKRHLFENCFSLTGIKK